MEKETKDNCEKFEFEDEDKLIENRLTSNNVKKENQVNEEIRTNNPSEYIRRIYTKFDPTFVTLLGTQYFNQGSKVLVGLATQKLFKDKFGLEPSYM